MNENTRPKTYHVNFDSAPRAGAKARYWLFGFDDYYPRGGMHDFVKSFDDLTSAITFGTLMADIQRCTQDTKFFKERADYRDNWQVVDRQTGSVCAQGVCDVESAEKWIQEYGDFLKKQWDEQAAAEEAKRQKDAAFAANGVEAGSEWITKTMDAFAEKDVSE